MRSVYSGRACRPDEVASAIVRGWAVPVRPTSTAPPSTSTTGRTRDEPQCPQYRLVGWVRMNELADRLFSPVVSAAEDALAREFEASLSECSSLAFRVAFSVLRQRRGAEDVAQDALIKAFRNLRQLRDRAKLRAWLVRTAWRMAIDRRDSDRRRDTREQKGPEIAPLPTGEDTALTEERSSRLWRRSTAFPEIPEWRSCSSIQEHDLPRWRRRWRFRKAR